MAYDLDQLNKDLEMIVRLLGKRVSRGFFTVGVYSDHLIRIVDHYIDHTGPEIFLLQKGEWVKLGKPFSTDCWAGARILSLAVQLEDNYKYE